MQKKQTLFALMKYMPSEKGHHDSAQKKEKWTVVIRKEVRRSYMKEQYRGIIAGKDENGATIMENLVRREKQMLHTERLAMMRWKRVQARVPTIIQTFMNWKTDTREGYEREEPIRV